MGYVLCCVTICTNKSLFILFNFKKIKLKKGKTINKNNKI